MDIVVNEIVTNKKVAEGFEGQQSCILPESKSRFCATHPICRMLYITDIGYYPHAKFHNRERVNGCAQHILIYCVKGEGWYKLNGTIHTVQPNQYFILPMNQPHEYGANDKNPWTIYWVHFKGENAEHLSNFIFPPKQRGPIATIPSPLRIMVFDDMLQHLELMNNQENIIYASNCLHTFLMSFKQIQLKTSNKIDNPVMEVMNIMKDNLHRNLTLEDMAQSVNISPSHFSALFRQKTKYSPVNLFTSLKVQKACQLLLESNYSIKMIAHSFGYDDQYHFSRVFKKLMGVSPKKFRDDNK